MGVRTSAALAAAAALWAASDCRAISLNFDDVPSLTNVATYYPGVVFSSEPGLTTVAYAYLGPSPFGPPNVLVPYNPTINVPTSVPDLYVDFTSPVNNLSFLAVAADEYGVVARVNVYSGANLLGTDDIIGTGPTPGTFGYGSTPVNLSAYSNVTRIEVVPPVGLSDLDSAYGGGGLVYDGFTFEPVPEPASATLLALAGLAAARRRRRR